MGQGREQGYSLHACSARADQYYIVIYTHQKCFTLWLQLKLRSAERAKTRDRAAGVWYIYHAVGGAMTVLKAD